MRRLRVCILLGGLLACHHAPTFMAGRHVPQEALNGWQDVCRADSGCRSPYQRCLEGHCEIPCEAKGADAAERACPYDLTCADMVFDGPSQVCYRR